MSHTMRCETHLDSLQIPLINTLAANNRLPIDPLHEKFVYRLLMIAGLVCRELGHEVSGRMLVEEIESIQAFDGLVVEYARLKLPQIDPAAWTDIAATLAGFGPYSMPARFQGRDRQIAAIEVYFQSAPPADVLMRALRSAMGYDRDTYGSVLERCSDIYLETAARHVLEHISKLHGEVSS